MRWRILFLFVLLMVLLNYNYAGAPQYALGTEENPVKCNGPDKKKEYLESLEGPDGNPITYQHIGHGFSSCDGHTLDKYKIVTADKRMEITIYIDQYCKENQTQDAVPGLHISGGCSPKQSSPISPPQKHKPISHGQVSSNPIQALTGSSEDSLPGFNMRSSPPLTKPSPNVVENNKIPGFDDNLHPPPPPPINISLMPVLISDIQSPSQNIDLIKETQVTDCIQKAFLSLNQASPFAFHINQPQHTFHDLPDEIKKLKDTLVSQEDDFVKKDIIISELIAPQQVDALVWGTLEEEGKPGHYTISLILVSHADQKLSKREWDYNYKNLNEKGILIEFQRNFLEFINTETQSLVAQAPTAPLVQPTNAQLQQNVQNKPNRFICLIPIEYKSAAKQTAQHLKKIAPLLQAETLQMLNTYPNPRFSINNSPPDQKNQNSGAVSQNLQAILHNPAFNDQEKIEKIKHGILIPNGADILVAIHLKRNPQNQIYSVSPYIISRDKSKIFSNDLIFPGSDLICRSTSTNDKTICPAALKNIKASLFNLMNQATK